MAQDNWNDRDRDERGWREGRHEDRGREDRGRERLGYGARGGRSEGPAGYNPAGPAQGGWSFDEREYGRGGGYRHDQRPHYERQPHGGAFGQPDYSQSAYGSRSREDYEHRGGEDRSWLERAGDRVARFFGEGEEGASHRGRGPRGYKRSDERIREDVNDRLTDDPWLDASAIEVTVTACEVTLNGAVTSRDDKRRAENLAESVSGVTHVQNNLRPGQRDETTSADLGARPSSTN